MMGCKVWVWGVGDGEVGGVWDGEVGVVWEEVGLDRS